MSIVQAKPARVRQTLSTKESALEFGLVSNCGRILQNLYSSFAFHSDGRLLNRMNAALLKSLKDTEKPRGERDLHDGNPQHLKGLQFNINSPLNEALAVRPICSMVDGGIMVQLPAFNVSEDLQLPKYTKNAVLRLMVAAISFREGYYEYLDYKDIPLQHGKVMPEQKWLSDVALPAGSIVLVSASLHCFGMKGIDGEPLSLNGKEYSPAEIIGAYRIDDEVKVEDEAKAENEVKSGTADQTVPEKAFPNRHRLINYRGEEILKEIARKRKRDKKYQERIAREKIWTSEEETVVDGMKLPAIGKVFYKKE
ncbi:hypothetical protein Pedsa_3521 [Pseudopedobacter saltans DSM 12145]|uniref:Uncharacterized protein n=1 Tax=Pseudopedobacter saltans (strain ATCC 51119 / DSM 12145 / JCM 21818 / CCUG 39354 / LMG 10337 / NBRC 100064 / NCIMB 13643) TaxID=762903 RepID=F0SEY3_PSESL|nr:hypothetical protein [Pseudopedobacter saltans]ADY54051.1 hypothetical protein Pedsa_3521 [Pseudopedobacter saltans DSM 12145]